VQKIKYKNSEKGVGRQCEKVLRSVPQWFGREDSLRQYVKEIDDLETFTAYDGDDLIGFISLNYHNKKSAELHVLAVKSNYHRLGIGTKLYNIVEKSLKKKGVVFLQVKTLSKSSGDKNYEKTRQFYIKIGFWELQEFPDLWGKDTPCLQMIKTI